MRFIHKPGDLDRNTLEGTYKVSQDKRGSNVSVGAEMNDPWCREDSTTGTRGLRGKDGLSIHRRPTLARPTTANEGRDYPVNTLDNRVS